MNDKIEDPVRIHIEQVEASVFFSLLQSGFTIVACTGCSIQSFLEEQLDITPQYIAERIKTVFLNGSPVDDYNVTMITNGDTLALSAAMPGLVGAVMRSGGVLASFRHAISARPTQACSTGAEGKVTVKLFNLLVKELGPGLLARGIWIESARFSQFFQRFMTDLTRRRPVVTINEQGADPDELVKCGFEAQNLWCQLTVA